MSLSESIKNLRGIRESLKTDDGRTILNKLTVVSDPDDVLKDASTHQGRGKTTKDAK